MPSIERKQSSFQIREVFGASFKTKTIASSTFVIPDSDKSSCNDMALLKLSIVFKTLNQKF
jgi:hypothetical protein